MDYIQIIYYAVVVGLMAGCLSALSNIGSELKKIRRHVRGDKIGDEY